MLTSYNVLPWTVATWNLKESQRDRIQTLPLRIDGALEKNILDRTWPRCAGSRSFVISVTIRCKGIFIWKFLCLVLTIYITLNKTQISILSAVVMNSIIPAVTVLGAFNILENQFTWLRYRTAAANGYRHILCNLSTLNIILRIINMFRICKFNYTNLTAVALN